jgi:hypothetical protein
MLTDLPQLSPLIDIGLAYIAELERPLAPEQLSRVRDVLMRYVGRVLSYGECVTALFPVIGTSQPIDRLEAILCVPPAPLPSSPALALPPEARAKTRPWTAYEDQRLLAAIHRFGFDAWQIVASFVGNGRTKAQCSQRWNRGLDPKICKEHWPREEDDRLMGLVARFGEKSWTRVAGEIGNRSDVQCRYRYKQLQKDPGFAERQAAALQGAKDAVVRPKPRRELRAKAADRFPVQFRMGVPDPFGCFYPQMMAVPFAPGMIAPPAVQFPMQPAVPPMPPPPPPPPVGPHPGPVIPPGNIDPAKLAEQPALPDRSPQISAQGSALDWQAPCGLSPSGSLFGISPMNSFKFES